MFTSFAATAALPRPSCGAPVVMPAVSRFAEKASPAMVIEAA